MRMTFNLLVNFLNFLANLITIVFVISLVKVHIQRKLPLLIVTNVVDFLGKQRLIAHTHAVNFVVKLIFSNFRVIVSCKIVLYLCHCKMRTVSLRFAQLTAKLRLRRFAEFKIF